MQVSSSLTGFDSMPQGAPMVAARVHAAPAVVRSRSAARRAPARVDRGMTAEATALFCRHQAVIEEVVRLVIRRGRVRREDGEDFRSTVMLRLLENDCLILRRFEGRSTLRTFLVRVVERMLLDCRVQQWGKWRPSLQARRLGRTAIQLEALVSRDGLSFTEAAECMRTNHRVRATVEELWQLYSRLPTRVRRRVVPLSELHNVAAAPDPGLLPWTLEASGALRGLRRAIGELAAEDRILLQHRFADGLRIVRIAELCGHDQKELYRRFTSILATLKRSMACHGIRELDVDRLVSALDALPRQSAVLIFRK